MPLSQQFEPLHAEQEATLAIMQLFIEQVTTAETQLRVSQTTTPKKTAPQKLS